MLTAVRLGCSSEVDAERVYESYVSVARADDIASGDWS